MRISLIVALTNNRVIGRANTIPWYLPRDMMWFKYHTLNKPIIMGRRTFESIGNQALLDRFNIVLTRRMFLEQCIFNCVFVRTPEEALLTVRKLCRNIDEVMIIGGGEVYNAFFPFVSRLYLTYINIKIYGDTLFPNYDNSEWRVVFNERHNFYDSGYDYFFKIFERV